ncbi:MAG: alpha/beta fold hydrolase [Acidobacteria bacterium]|nr:alpha/beta fold hydrolase [Acidobacteriota bacterium]
MVSRTFRFLLLSLVLFSAVFAQTLTVKDIMREPSVAGMRPEAERLSPDGRFVVYAWSAEGREPRDLYIVNADGSNARILVSAERNFEPRATPPESKLDYGLTVRDDFQKAREKNLGGVDISPDSKRILFLQNTDIYVLDLEDKAVLTDEEKAKTADYWRRYEEQIVRRANLIPNLIETLKTAGVIEKEIFDKLAGIRSKLLNAINEKPADDGQSAARKDWILQTDSEFAAGVERLRNLRTNYPSLRSNASYSNLLDELQGIENRLAVAKIDYDRIAKESPTIKPRRITRTAGVEAGARWLTNDAILYSSNGNYFVLNLRETALVQITKEANPAAFVSVFNVAPTRDGKLIAYVVSDGSKQRALFVPNYLDEFVQTPTTRRGFTEQKLFVTPADGSLEKPYEIKLPKAEGAGYLRSVKWAADNASLVVDRVDQDLKRRQLFYVYLAGSKAEKTILVTEERDAKWIAPLSRIVEPHPADRTKILFASERDGYNHLYLATLERAAPEPNPSGEIRQEVPGDAGFTGKIETKQLTQGAFEIDWAKWMSRQNAFVYSSTETGTATRDFYVGTETGSRPFFSGEKGMKTSPQLSDAAPADDVLLYEFSKWNRPTELYTFQECANCDAIRAPRKLTASAPDAFLQTNWSAPKFVDIPARDGKIIKAKIYLPEDFNKVKDKPKGKTKDEPWFPMVVFVHGAGYLQNTIDGWNNYYREFMFNELLVQKGYVVLDIDYRGSAGYGRDWRTDVYDFLGGRDYEDHLDAIDFMVKNYRVDPKKIGAYGGSYGGFMAEMLAFRTDKIACAAALRPVADWKNYFASSPVYTAERLGFPEKNVEAYKRSSPIAYAGGLDKPLLILHGLVDDNVPAQDSMQLIEKLIRLEKTDHFEAMIYPSENHGFTRPSSWTDEYTRILNFFDKHLK